MKYWALLVIIMLVAAGAFYAGGQLHPRIIDNSTTTYADIDLTPYTDSIRVLQRLAATSAQPRTITVYVHDTPDAPAHIDTVDVVSAGTWTSVYTDDLQTTGSNGDTLAAAITVTATSEVMYSAGGAYYGQTSFAGVINDVRCRAAAKPPGRKTGWLRGEVQAGAGRDGACAGAGASVDIGRLYAGIMADTNGVLMLRLGCIIW